MDQNLYFRVVSMDDERLKSDGDSKGFEGRGFKGKCLIIVQGPPDQLSPELKARFESIAF